MGKALYRKYRSRSLDEIVGQEHITTTLRNALAAGKISHAYLLTGPRGVGKTSIARILAHEINGLAYNESPHLDIIEIDAASNNGVEDVRELRDKIMSAPASARYKIFIIDEVHMLSRAAFNALLKTLEEPPEHVIFILATTEAHKLPPTIISRTQRYAFRPVAADKVIHHLRAIADQEHITIDDDALALMAAHGEGSFRDSISLLDQASSLSDHITREQVEALLGRVSTDEIASLTAAILRNDTSESIEILQRCIEQGYEPAMVALQLGQALRTSLNTGIEKDANAPKVLALLHGLLAVPAAHNPGMLLEITLLQHTLGPSEGKNEHGISPAATVSKTATKPQPQQPTPKIVTPQEIVADKPVAKEKEPSTQNTPAAKDTDRATDETSTSGEIDELWHEILQKLKKTHNTLYGIARMAKPTFEENVLKLELTFNFHQKRLNEPQNLAVLTKIAEDVRGAATKIRCVLVQPARPDSQRSDAVATISNIFGGAELLD